MRTERVIDEAFSYGDAENAKYEGEGYCIFQKFLTPAALGECRVEIDRMLQQLQPGRAPDDIIGAHEQEPWIRDLEPSPTPRKLCSTPKPTAR